MSIAIHWSAVQSRICPACPERKTARGCGEGNSAACSLRRCFPELLQAVRGIRFESGDESLASLRRIACAVCIQKGMAENCVPGSDPSCAMNRFFDRVVRTIQDTEAFLVEAA